MRTTALSQRTFDYGDLSKSEVSSLERHATTVEKITERVRKTHAEGVIQVGQELTAARERLAHRGNGTFNKWVRERCGVSVRTAYNAIKSYESFGGCAKVAQTFDASALYLLSADTCPEEATLEAIELAEQGERITHKRAKELAEKYTVDAEPQQEAAGGLPLVGDIYEQLDELLGSIRELTKKDPRAVDIVIAQMAILRKEILHEHGLIDD